MRYSDFADLDINDKDKFDHYVDNLVAKAFDDEKLTDLKPTANDSTNASITNNSTFDQKPISAQPIKPSVPKSTSKHGTATISVKNYDEHFGQTHKVKVPIPIPYSPPKLHSKHKEPIFKRKLRALGKFLPPLYPSKNILDI